MKKIICGMLTAALLLAMCAACGQKEPEAEAAFPAAATVQALLESGAFSEELEELEPTLLFPLSGDAEVYAGSVLYYSTGATAETAAVIAVGDAQRVDETEAALRSWLDGQLEAERDYRPAEAAKLENAILQVRGSSVLLVVAADYEKANAVITE